MPDFVQRSFAGGEIAPAVYGRADQVKYQTGLRVCRNFFVRRHGGVSNRPGSGFVAEVKDSTAPHRIFKFVFNADQTYVLLFGPLTMRVVRNGAQLTVSGVVAWSNATNYVVGDLASYLGINYYCVLAHLNQAPPNATYWYPLTGNIYEIPTPYTAADLVTMEIDTQSGDVVSIDHLNYAPRELRRYGHTKWVLALSTFLPAQASPTGVAVSVGVAGAVTYRYKVTAIAADTFEESIPSLGASLVLTAATQANPCVVTSAAHGLVNGDEVYLDAVVGMTAINGLTVKVAGVTANTFQLSGVVSTAYAAYISGGTAQRTATNVVCGTPTLASPNVVTWTAAPGAQEYDVYKESNGFFGYIGNAVGTSFSDTNITVGTVSAPQIRNPFATTGNYPKKVGYFDQRRAHANTTNHPEKVWLSKPGQFTNFSISSPLQPDDAITFTIAGKQVNEIRHLVDLGALIILTAGGEWNATGDASGMLTPGSPGLKQVGYNGSAELPPIIVGNNLLFVQARGNMVRDLRSALQANGTTGFSGDDLTVFAPHLFDGYTLVRWDFAQIPHSTAWAVRSDGVLLGMTYIKAHEISGWHRHDTDGLYEDVVVVPEGGEDAVYSLVNRTINGATKRYLERFHSRRVTDIEVDALFLDSYLTYNGWNTGATTMTLSGGTTWAYSETLTLTASAATFTAGDVGNAIILSIGGVRLQCNITAYTGSAMVVSVQAVRNIEAAFRAVPTVVWARAVDDLTGLDHLEGKSVGILADGNVVANGLDAPLMAVTAGAIHLDRPYAIVHVGLPYISDMELLDLEVLGTETISPKMKHLSGVTIVVEASRGMWVGPSSDRLHEKRPDVLEASVGRSLFTGKIEMGVASTWNNTGRVWIRQRDPLPLTVLSVMPNGDVGG